MSWGWEQVLFLAVAGLACWATLGTWVRARRLAALTFAVLFVPVVATWAVWTPPSPGFAESTAPAKITDQGYVSSDTCRACHPAEYASWRASYHRTMTQVASPESIAAPRKSMSLRGNDRAFEVRFEDDVMWADDIHPIATLLRLASTTRTLPGPLPVSTASETIPKDIRRYRSRVAMTTGSHHMQIYWLRDPKGAFRHLSWVWLIRDQRWVPGEAVYLQPPNGTIGLVGQWETNCIKCHSVGGQPRTALGPNATSGSRSRLRSKPPHDPKTGELGIACEACHGPAAEHVRTNSNPLRRYARYLSDDDETTIIHPNKIDRDRSSEICGRCHSGHVQLAWDANTGTPFAAGDVLEDYFQLRKFETQPADRRSGYFWKDGTVRVTGREYSGMIQSACYTRGNLGCSSCHSMHESDPDDQLARDREGDAACLQCHEGMAGRIEEHTHHPQESSGSRCYNCHMPNTTYGLLSVTRSHRIDSPNVEMSARSGRPNACNLCHVDRTLAWAGDRMAEWYAHERSPLDPDEERLPAAALWLLKGDAAQRAVAAWHFGWQPVLEASGRGWQAPLLARSLDDPYAAVRYLSERSLRKLPAFDALTYDFVGPASERASAVAAALEIAGRSLPSASEIRLGPDEIDRLRSERDETPITFQE